MIAEVLKERIDQLSKDQRHEVSVYLTKVQLESDSDYWKTIRRRSADKDLASWININDV